MLANVSITVSIVNFNMNVNILILDSVFRYHENQIIILSYDHNISYILNIQAESKHAGSTVLLYDSSYKHIPGMTLFSNYSLFYDAKH